MCGKALAVVMILLVAPSLGMAQDPASPDAKPAKTAALAKATILDVDDDANGVDVTVKLRLSGDQGEQEISVSVPKDFTFEAVWKEARNKYEHYLFPSAPAAKTKYRLEKLEEAEITQKAVDDTPAKKPVLIKVE